MTRTVKYTLWIAMTIHLLVGKRGTQSACLAALVWLFIIPPAGVVGSGGTSADVSALCKRTAVASPGWLGR